MPMPVQTGAEIVLEHPDEQPVKYTGCQLLFLLAGQAKIKQDSLFQGEMLLLPPYTEASVQFPERTTLLRYQFAQESPGEIFHPILLKMGQPLLTQLQQELSRLAKTYLDDIPVAPEVLSARTKAALNLLRPLWTESHPEAGDPRLGEIASYLAQNFRQPVVQAQVAQHFSMTPSYFSRLFHAGFGMTFLQYVLQLRTETAAQQLRNTKNSVTKIAYECGFSTTGSMNDAFRSAFSCTPSQYRRTPVSPENRMLSDMLEPYMNGTFHLTLEAETKTVRMAEGKPFARIWNDCIDIPNAADCLMSHQRQKLDILQHNLHFRYARLGNLLNRSICADLPEYSGRQYVYVIEILNFIMSLGLIPMLDLAIKPLIRANDLIRPEKDDIGMLPFPVFRDFLDMCLRRWGQEVVSRWRFEFWMPHQWSFRVEDAPTEAYLNTLSECVAYLKEQVPDAKWGGPGYTADAYSLETLKEIMTGMRQRNLMPDFVTFSMFYPAQMQPAGEQGNPERLHRVRLLPYYPELEPLAQQIREVLQDALGTVPTLLLTEAGISYLTAPGVHDSGCRSAYTAKIVTDAVGRTDGLGIWKAFNEEEEHPDDFMLVCGGSGLMLRADLKTGPYYIVALLQTAGEHVCFRNAHCQMTGSSQNVWLVMVHNFKHLSYDACANVNRTDLMEPLGSDAFRDYRPYQLTLHLEQLPPGDYSLRSYRIDDYDCNVVSILRTLNFSNISRTDLQYIQSRAVPLQQFQRMTDQDLRELTISCQPNQVAVCEIAKLPRYDL